MEKENNTEVSRQLPELGHQLRVSKCQSMDGWYCISLMPAQKIRSFALIFVQGLLLSVVVMIVLFGPDFLFDYSHRGSEFVAFFWKFITIACLLVTVCSFFVMLMRCTSVFVNLKENKIVCANRLTAKCAVESVSISEIESIEAEPVSGMLKRARLIVRVHDADVVLAETLGDNEDIIELRDWIRQ